MFLGSCVEPLGSYRPCVTSDIRTVAIAIARADPRVSPFALEAGAPRQARAHRRRFLSTAGMVAKSPAKRIQGGKKVRVQQDLKAIKSEARADQARAILLEIMERLQDDDELAADVLAALKEGFFDDSGADRLMLHESYTYLTKVPKYVEIQNLEQMDSRFTREVLRRLSKPDNRVVKRLHSLATLTDPTMRIPSHDLHIFKAWALWRHRDGKEKLKAVQWDASYNIDWQSCGVFSLKPAFEQRGADEDDEAFARRRKEHQYTHLAFETLQVALGVSFPDPLVSPRAQT